MIKDNRLQRAIKRGFSVSGLRVLEPSCGHGHVTRDLCEMGADVTTFDVRQENLNKAAELCRADSYSPTVMLEDAENVERFGSFPVVVHFGLLYHLEQPKTHLLKVLGVVSDTLLLDTHVCEDAAAVWVNDFSWGAWWHEGSGDFAAKEGQRQSWWLTRDGLRHIMEEAGFLVDQLSDDKHAANGRRVLYLATRK